MVEQENMKVYELAKELGVDSISLLDKLNALNIKVKNHMSSLGAHEVQIARTSLGKKPSKSAKSTRAKTSADGAPKKVAARTRKKAAAADSAAPSAAAEPEIKETADRKAAAPVIRRRVHSDGATDETVISSAGHIPYRTENLDTQTPEESKAQLEAQQSPDGSEAAAQGLAGEYEAAATQEGEHAAPAETAADAQASDASAESGAAAQAATPDAKHKKQIVLPPRPVAPRRSILKIVEPSAPPPRPMFKPPESKTPAVSVKPAVRGTTSDATGTRITRITKENLDQMVEEEAQKKRGGGGGRELEIRPEDVRFADYRKKEMVFLPKKKRIPVGKELKKTEITTPKAIKRVVEMGETITVGDLAAQMGVKATEIVRKLMGMGQMAGINQAIDIDTASLVASEYDYEVKNISFKEEVLLDTETDTEDQLQPRPPVVTIMGHVDHGKTSLLDAIREANVAAGEAGGITQHIGAYTVQQNGKFITFIDTPGHEAFTVMRARGANVTDIVILVVAADDGVMPQTREALSHAKAAGVPIIVAMNKMDKPQANPEKIKQQLAELDLLAEEWGGETMFVPVSAIAKTNLDKLLESILLQAEILDLKANPNARASGTVLEGRLEKGRGPVVSVLVKRGTLRVGDPIVSGPHAGKVRALIDHHGNPIKEAGPGYAAEILGFEGVPNAGDKFDSPKTEADARKIAENRAEQARAQIAGSKGNVSLDQLFSKIQSGDLKELNVILKADVFGSVEAVRDSLVKLSNEKVKVKVIHAAPGGITESDVLLAGASDAIIIGFNVRPETKARQIAEAEHVDIKCYSIIYELIEDVKTAMVGLLEKKKVEKFLGRAAGRQTISVPKVGTIAGSAVIDGKIVRGANVRLLRDSRIIFEGKMSSLKRFKDDAKEVATGYECGIGLENYNDLKPGDLIEAYQIEFVTPELNG